jgi:hypothetical protein
MFGRKPKLPLDLLFPQPDADRRTMDEPEDMPANNIEILDEVPPPRKPEETQTIDRLKRRLKKIGKILMKHKVVRMELAKVNHDRKIKREIYKVGDQVLCSHPKLTKKRHLPKIPWSF